MNSEKNTAATTTFWGNSKQKIYEVENRHYLHKYNNHYQYLGNVMSWNVIKVENGFVDLELVIKISLKYKNILFRTKNDVCASFGLPSIAPSNLVKKIIS